MPQLLMIIGLVVVVLAYNSSTTVDGTHNLGLLQQQMMALHTGLALLIISAIRWEHRLPTQLQQPLREQLPPGAELDAVDQDYEDARRKKIAIGALIGVAVIIAALVLFGP